MNLYKVVESNQTTYLRSMADATKFSKTAAKPCWIHALDAVGNATGKQLVVDLLNDACSWTMVKAFKSKTTISGSALADFGIAKGLARGAEQVPAWTRQGPDGVWSHSGFATEADITAGKALRRLSW